MTPLNDGGVAPPRLQIGVCGVTLLDLPAFSSGPRGEPAEVLAAVRAAGYEALQITDTQLLEAMTGAGVRPTALARMVQPAEARAAARRGKDWGCDCTTLHVGTGFETDREALLLLDAVLDASAAESYPLLVETHRATVTESMQRTLEFVATLPELRFIGDFSHWYTGGEMTYGDLPAKLERLRPVVERTRFLHGRVSTPGCIQVPVSDGRHAAHTEFFRHLWTEAFSAFLRNAGPGDIFGFYPELLPPRFHYAREILAPDGALVEESDRWVEARYLVELARQCWAAAGGRPADEGEP